MNYKNNNFLDNSLTVRFSDGKIVYIPDIFLTKFQKAFQINNEEQMYKHNITKIFNINKLIFDIQITYNVSSIFNNLNYKYNSKNIKSIFSTIFIFIEAFIVFAILKFSKSRQEKFLDSENVNIREQFLIDKFFLIGNIMNKLSNEILERKPISIYNEECLDRKKIYYFFDRYEILKIMNLCYQSNLKLEEKFSFYNTVYFVYDKKEKKLYSFSEIDLNEYIYFETEKNIFKDGLILPFYNSKQSFNNNFQQHEIKILELEE